MRGESCVAGTCTCGWSTLALGWLQTCAVRSDGTVVCAGGFNSGCNGAQSEAGGGLPTCGAPATGPHAPGVVPGLTSVKEAQGGSAFFCALKTDGTVWCLGGNKFGALGNGDAVPSPRPSPVQVRETNAPNFLSDVKQLSVGMRHSCALKNSGQVWCWGQGSSGELGNGQANSSLALQATLPGGLVGVKKVAAGESHTCVISGADTVWCWGHNGLWQCGNSNASPQLTPTEITGLSGVVDLTSTRNHTCALKSDKTVWCWGANNQAQAGQLKTSRVSPSPVPLTDVAQVVAGTGHTCARKTDGTVWCWGRNAHGEVGNNTVDGTADREPGASGQPSPSPQPVLTAAGTPLVAKSIAANHGHSCALIDASDHPWCWGNNIKGQAAILPPMSSVATPIYSCGR
jgi:alpha-tubulin suppressor-like RCC1 family protein